MRKEEFREWYVIALERYYKKRGFKLPCIIDETTYQDEPGIVGCFQKEDGKWVIYLTGKDGKILWEREYLNESDAFNELSLFYKFDDYEYEIFKGDGLWHLCKIDKCKDWSILWEKECSSLDEANNVERMYCHDGYPFGFIEKEDGKYLIQKYDMSPGEKIVWEKNYLTYDEANAAEKLFYLADDKEDEDKHYCLKTEILLEIITKDIFDEILAKTCKNITSLFPQTGFEILNKYCWFPFVIGVLKRKDGKFVVYEMGHYPELRWEKVFLTEKEAYVYWLYSIDHDFKWNRYIPKPVESYSDLSFKDIDKSIIDKFIKENKLLNCYETDEELHKEIEKVYTEYRYCYDYVDVIYDEDGKCEYVDKIGYCWTTDLNHVGLTGEKRTVRRVYNFYTIMLNSDKKLVLKENMGG